MALIRTPVIPMKTPIEEKLTEGEIININNGESIGIVKDGRVFNLLENMTDKVLRDESVYMNSRIKYDNSIGYFDRDDNILMYKLYGIAVDMNNSDYNGNVSHHTEFAEDIEISDFIDNFLGFKKEIIDNKIMYTFDKFYFSYSTYYNKLTFLVSKEEREGYHSIYASRKVSFTSGDVTSYRSGEDNRAFDYKYLILFTSLLWLLFKSTNLEHNLNLLKEYNIDLYNFYKMIGDDIWIYDTSKIKRDVLEGYVSGFEVQEDGIPYPNDFDGSSNLYFAIKYKCTDSDNFMVYYKENEIGVINDSSVLKNTIIVSS